MATIEFCCGILLSLSFYLIGMIKFGSKLYNPSIINFSSKTSIAIFIVFFVLSVFGLSFSIVIFALAISSVSISKQLIDLLYVALFFGASYAFFASVLYSKNGYAQSLKDLQKIFKGKNRLKY